MTTYSVVAAGTDPSYTKGWGHFVVASSSLTLLNGSFPVIPKTINLTRMDPSTGRVVTVVVPHAGAVTYNPPYLFGKTIIPKPNFTYNVVRVGAKVFIYTTSTSDQGKTNPKVASGVGSYRVQTYVAWPVVPSTGQLWPRGGYPGH